MPGSYFRFLEGRPSWQRARCSGPEWPRGRTLASRGCVWGGRHAEGAGRSLSSEPPTLSEPAPPPCGSWTPALRQPRWLCCRPRALVPKRRFLKSRPVCCHFLAQDPPRPCRALKALQGLRGIHAPSHLPAWPWEEAQPPQDAPCCVPGPQKPALPSFLQVSAQMSPETPLAPPLPCCVDVSSVGAGNGPVSLRVPYRPSGGTRF